MSQSYRLRIQRASLKMKVATRIPAQFTAASPLVLDKTGGIYALTFDVDALEDSLTSASVGLGNVDNTSDADKPVSTATQAALDLKANIAAPELTDSVKVSGTQPVLWLRETDGGADAKNWKFDVAAGLFTAYITNDADDTATVWMRATRSGNSVTNVDFRAFMSQTLTSSFTGESCFKVTHGTSGSPVTTVDSDESGVHALRYLNKTVGLSSDLCLGVQNAGLSSGLFESVCTSGSQQTFALRGGVFVGTPRASGTACADKVGVYGEAQRTTGTDGVWAGNFLTEVTNLSGPTIGIEVDLNNRSASDPGVNPTHSFFGVSIVNGDQYRGGTGLVINRNGGYSNNEWNRGVYIKEVLKIGLEIGNVWGGTAEAAILGNQLADGKDTVLFSRFTDTSPTGSLIRFVNAANSANLFRVFASGAVQLNQAVGGTNAAGDLAADTIYGRQIVAGWTGTASGIVSLFGTTSGQISIKAQDAAGTYNFNLPTTAGSSGQMLLSGGGSTTAMTWATPVLLSGANTWGATQTIEGASSGVLALRSSATNPTSTIVGTINYRGQDSVGTNTVYCQMNAVVDDYTDGSEDATYRFATMVAGSLNNRLYIAGGLFHPSATGGDKGNNTINFGAVYDDNTLLTCYPFDAYLDGDIDEAKWDDMVPDVYDLETGETTPRRHEAMRKFKARLGTDSDPLDLDRYIEHWRKKRHLTSLPNESKFDPAEGLPTGVWIQRLIETVEIQAIHIGQLHERAKVLERRAAH